MIDQLGVLALAASAGFAVLALLCFVGDAIERAFFPEDAARRERTSEPPMVAFGLARRHHTRPDRRP